jgi:hypothetical protein
MGLINPMLHHDESEWSAERPVVYESHADGQSIVLWIVVLILAAVLGALVYYGYRTVKTQDLRITQVFGSQGIMATLGQRADVAESKLRDLASDGQGMTQRMAKLEGRVAADARQTRLYAETLTQKLHQQIIAEMDARTSPLDARLRQVESEQQQQRAQLTQVETNLKQDISAVQAENGRNVSGVREQEEQDAQNVAALSQKLDRQRIDFELTKGQSKELAPGVSLRIAGVNPIYQRYHGSLWLLQDHRTVWLQGQSVNEPVRFFHKDGGEPYELVVTDVTRKSVAGYLLVPVKPEGVVGASASQPSVMDGQSQE